MGRAPTAAQSKFAAGILAGKTKTEAYAIAHPNDKSQHRTLRNEASRASQSPGVLAEIERIRKEPIILEQFPDATNPHALRAHAVATMARLTQHVDPIIAMRAADWIREYADKLEQSPMAAAAGGNAQLVADLRGLYQKALKAAPLIETVAEIDEKAP
jgi:hypothetical protein